MTAALLWAAKAVASAWLTTVSHHRDASARRWARVEAMVRRSVRPRVAA